MKAVLIPLLLVPTFVALPPLLGEGLDAPVIEGSKVTYADLIRLVCPDLEVDKDNPESGAATKAIAIRDLGVSGEAQPREDVTINIQSVSKVAYARPRVLITFTIPVGDGGPERMLALFDLTATPKLVDVVGVPQFPDDAGSISQIMRINNTTEAYVFSCNHFNSQQSYEGHTILFVRDDRVELIEELGTLNCSGCASGDFEEGVTLSTASDPGRTGNKIVIQVTLKRLQDPPDSEHRPRRRPYTRLYTAEYRFDGKRFTTLSKELDQLRAFNKENY